MYRFVLFFFNQRLCLNLIDVNMGLSVRVFWYMYYSSFYFLQLRIIHMMSKSHISEIGGPCFKLEEGGRMEKVGKKPLPVTRCMKDLQMKMPRLNQE